MFLFVSGLERKDRICGAFIMSAPFAPFMFLWVDRVLNDYRVKKWAHISGVIPTDLAARYYQTGIVHIEASTIHRPNYNELNKLIGPDHYDLSKNYAVHLFYRVWSREKWMFKPDPENIKKSNTTFGQIARFIYYGSPDMF